MKGAPWIFANLLAISVLPIPVGPIISMFFGETSSFKFFGSKCRLYRFPVFFFLRSIFDLEQSLSRF